MRSQATDHGRQSELALLERIRTRSARGSQSRLRLGIGDDCALLRLRPSEELAVTTDLSIEGRHFRLDWHSPEAIGHRALARGLSDLAAVGARPVAAFLSLGVPKALVEAPGRRQPRSGSFIDRFLDGFLALAEAHATPLAGGDLAESPIAVADIVLTGAVRRGKALLRSGAHAGDSLYVTGSLGGAAAGLAELAQLAEGSQRVRGARRLPPQIPVHLMAEMTPHLFPQPRVAQGLWLARRSAATAAIDISDGLSTDLAHLCEESGVAAEIDGATLPIHPTATFAQALHGGENYELLFTARSDRRLPRSIAGVSITRIGRVLRRRSDRPMVRLITEQGMEPLTAQGWEHFS